MTKPVKMPELGESITEGTITRWLKKEGDHVEADEPLFEVSTDKVDTEVPSPAAGILQSIKVGEDETVEVGAELAVIADEGAASEGAPGHAGEEPEGEEPQADAGTAEAAEAEEPQADAGTGEAAEADGATAEDASGGDETIAEEATEGAGEETADQDERKAASGAQDGDQAQGGATPRRSSEGQTTPVKMPELGESITEGTITRWLKEEGDTVAADEPLFEVSTDKVDTEVPAPVAGVLQSIKVAADETAEVGAELAVISSGADGAAEKEPASTKEAPRQEADAPTEQQPDSRNGDAALLSPLVRRLVREHDVDVSKISGTGSGGRIRRQDVEAFLEQGSGQPAGEPAAAAATPQEPAAGPTPPSGKKKATKPAGKDQPSIGVAVPLASGIREEVVPATRLRRVIAERMVASKRTSAHLTTAVEIDMTRVMRLREEAKDAFKEREGVSLSPLPFAVLALVAAIREHPQVNAALDADGNLHLYKDVNLGLAVDTAKGLFVPVVKNADTLNLSGLARAIADVAKRTREGKIDPGELAGSTITVTNTGSVGAVWDTPIINQPNVAIFATPAIVKRPVVVSDPELGDVVAIRSMMYGILTYDHRVVDGADAARFLVKVKDVLEAADFAGELGVTQ